MTYPDGSQIRVGDLIWWDEGHCLGHVQAIAESQADYESWGLVAPHIFISTRHPFDPTLATRHADGGVPVLVSYDVASFDDEGIGLLSPAERQEFERARQAALLGRGCSCFSVTTHVESGTLRSWIFRLLDEHGRETVVTIPYEKPAA
ncbi:MAG: hypothetical protein HS117_21765 [Verrucomicrobiaceae bacterium]|nr:hypothetical protein [Verrucomicrobiaceae bacterium]